MRAWLDSEPRVFPVTPIGCQVEPLKRREEHARSVAAAEQFLVEPTTNHSCLVQRGAFVLGSIMTLRRRVFCKGMSRVE